MNLDKWTLLPDWSDDPAVTSWPPRPAPLGYPNTAPTPCAPPAVYQAQAFQCPQCGGPILLLLPS